MVKNAFSIKFGELVRQKRRDAGLSQEEFAHLCKLHRTYVGSIERGEKNITLETAKKVADALNIRLATIIDQAEETALQ